MKRLYTYIILFVIMFSAFMVVMPCEVVYAKTLAQLQAEQKELKAKQDNANTALKNAKDNQAKVNAEIEVLDSELTLVEKELEIVEQQLLESEEKLADSQIKLEEATIAREDQTEAFSKRIKYIYENGSVGYLKVLLESKSFTDFLTRLQYVNDIMRYDEETLDRLKKFEMVIEIQTVAIEEATKEIEILVEDQRIQRASLDVKISEKNELYLKYQRDEQNYEEVVKSMEDASNEVQKLINNAIAAQNNSGAARSYTVYYTGGQLQWPVPGRSYISSGYGNRKRPIGSGYEFHTGIDIPAAYGANIVAAEAGTVMTSSYVRGYGYTVIINHGNGLTTLYGHNSSNSVKVGDVVTRGQVIAKAGSTGNSTGNHCHFEVRLNGNHVNPSGYLGI